MNFAQYNSLKKKFRRKVVFSRSSLIFLDVMFIVQLVFLIGKKSMSFVYFNINLLEQFFSNAYQHMSSGNVVLGFMFYGAIACLFIALALCTYGVFKDVRFAYSCTIILYLVDMWICIVTKNYGQMLTHMILLLIMFMGSSNIKRLKNLPKDIWG